MLKVQSESVKKATGYLSDERHDSVKREEIYDRRKTPGALVAVCAWCKKIRDTKGSWVVPENYGKELSSERVTHGICPACLEERSLPVVE